MGSVSTYAYGGSEGSPCTENRVTGEHEHHYGSPGRIGYDFARPIPTHALTPGAIAAVQRMHDEHAARRLSRAVSSLVTEHGNPRPVELDAPVSARAKSLAAKARAAGFDVKIVERVNGCDVIGHRGDVAFAAHWTDGATTGATWHERRARWVLVADDRPIAMDAKNHVGKKGARSTGMGKTRLKLVASPRGLAVNVTELEKRISA